MSVPSIHERCAVDHISSSVCPGQHVANKQVLSFLGGKITELTDEYRFYRSLFITIALALWSFDLSVDESRPADDLAFLNGVTSSAPIGLHFKPRMAKEKLMMMMEQ